MIYSWKLALLYKKNASKIEFENTIWMKNEKKKILEKKILFCFSSYGKSILCIFVIINISKSHTPYL